MTAVEGHAGWYRNSISHNLANVIFITGTGAQTNDLTIDTTNVDYDGAKCINSFTKSFPKNSKETLLQFIKINKIRINKCMQWIRAKMLLSFIAAKSRIAKIYIYNMDLLIRK